MEKNICIAFSGLSLAFMLLFTLHLASTQTIDEMIVEATDSVSSLDFMADLSGNLIRQELDMLLTLDQYRALQELETVSSFDDPSKLSRKKRKAIRAMTHRWTNNQIPYQIDTSAFSYRDQNEIRSAMREWEENTCIQFRQASNRDSNYVRFENGGGCYSYVGMTGGAQTIGLAGGCRHHGIIVHEIGHAVGFHHEQNRPDRDEYVIIQRQNIPSNLYYNFKKYPWSAVTTLDVPYDYGSVMHYGGKAFSQNGQYTIKTINPAYQNTIGNRKGLSFNDIKLANLMYKCNERCSSTIRCPSQGFVGKDCKCYCPGNPIKLCDDSGSKVTDRPTVTTRPTVEVSCRDMNNNCPGWAKSSYMYCQTNTYVKTYCKKSCGSCNGEGVTVKPCIDLKQHCDFWKNQGYCKGMFEVFMTEHCPKSCNACRGSGRSQTNTGGRDVDSNEESETHTDGRVVVSEKEMENGSIGRQGSLAVITGLGMMITFYHLF